MSSREDLSLWRLFNAGVALEDLRTIVIDRLVGDPRAFQFQACAHKLNSDFTITGWDQKKSALQINSSHSLVWASDTVGVVLGIAYRGPSPLEAYSRDTENLVLAERSARGEFLRTLSHNDHFLYYVRDRFVDLGIYSEDKQLSLEAAHCFNEELKRQRKFNWITHRVDVVRGFLSRGGGALNGADRQLLSEYVRSGITLIAAVKLCMRDAEEQLKESRIISERALEKAVKDNSNYWSRSYQTMKEELESNKARVDTMQREMDALREEFRRNLQTVQAAVDGTQNTVGSLCQGFEAYKTYVTGCLDSHKQELGALARQREEDEKRWACELAILDGQADIQAKNVGLVAVSVTENLAGFRKKLHEVDSSLVDLMNNRPELEAANKLLGIKDAQLADAQERIRALEQKTASGSQLPPRLRTPITPGTHSLYPN